MRQKKVEKRVKAKVNTTSALQCIEVYFVEILEFVFLYPLANRSFETILKKCFILHVPSSKNILKCSKNILKCSLNYQNTINIDNSMTFTRSPEENFAAIFLSKV